MKPRVPIRGFAGRDFQRAGRQVEADRDRDCPFGNDDA